MLSGIPTNMHPILSDHHQFFKKSDYRYNPAFKDVSIDIKNLYCRANSPTGLRTVAEEKYVYAFALKADEKYIGFVLVQFNIINQNDPFIQIKRMHDFHETTNGHYFGVGKVLLNVVATIGKLGGMNKLLTTAPFPIQSYFEHLKWNGKMIYTDFKLNDRIVSLPQFKCSFNTSDEFKRF